MPSTTHSLFSVTGADLEVAKISVDVKSASIPLVLGATPVYLTLRWVHEFAMMPRHVRRWPLAQLDFRFVIGIIRFSLVGVAAGALNRSIWIPLAIFAVLSGIAFVATILSVLMAFVTLPLRFRARKRTGRLSAANAVTEGIAWAVFLAACLTIVTIVITGIASYNYQPLRALWPAPPNPFALTAFVLSIAVVTASYLFVGRVMARLFARRPCYRTARGDDGKLQITFIAVEKEPLL